MDLKLISLKKALSLDRSKLIYIGAFFLCFAACSKNSIPQFEGKRAYRYLKEQCDFGPRVPGTKAHEDCLNYYVKFFKDLGVKPEIQRFTSLNYAGNFIPMANIIARFKGKSERSCILMAHWDSRPWADKDTNEEARNKPILGANDGASGVAILMEIANHIAKKPPKYNVTIVLFDGEDFGMEGDYSNYLLGSKYFAKNISPPFPEFGILLDMVGDSTLKIYKEGYSVKFAPALVDTIFSIAKELNFKEFIPAVKHYIIDDHLPLNEAGIPTINIISFEYKYWHTLNDTPDKCSAKSLETVGTVVLHLLYTGRY